jgi:hypothetical protein
MWRSKSLRGNINKTISVLLIISIFLGITQFGGLTPVALAADSAIRTQIIAEANAAIETIKSTVDSEIPLRPDQVKGAADAIKADIDALNNGMISDLENITAMMDSSRAAWAQKANVNCDGTVNMQDVLLVYQFYRGKISSFS